MGTVMDVLDGSRNLTQQLTYELGKAIIQGKYQADAPFPTEAELSSQFSISRSVTREAVKMLTAKGLICSRPRKGIRVQPPRSWNMFDTDVLNWTSNAKASLPLLLEITQLRLAIEPEAAALACVNGSPVQISAIANLAKRFGADHQHGAADLLDYSTQLGVFALESSGNRFYTQFCSFLLTAKRIGVTCLTPAQARRYFPADLLESVFVSVLERDADTARSAMRYLLSTFAANLEQLCEAKLNTERELEVEWG